MRLHLQLGRQSLILAMAIAVALGAPRRASADVITIHDGAVPGTTRIPFTCSVGTDNPIWLPYMGFVYRDVEAFQLSPGDIIAFDIQMPPLGPQPNLGFYPQLDIALAHASNATPFIPDNLRSGGAASDFTIVAHAATAASQGNPTAEDYDLAFKVDAPFSFPGGGLIIRVANPLGPLATKTDLECLQVITADNHPNGTNRLVGTFKLDMDGEYDQVQGWENQNAGSGADVPYVQIRWTRCGDGMVTGNEMCDDGNADNTDDCTNACQPAACGDGFVQKTEECDNSAHPDTPDPFCDDTCHLGAVAKGTGCSAGGGVGIVAALVILVFARRRRAAGLAVLVGFAWAGSAHAQSKTDGFRVDRFEMAPSVEDGLVVQDPAVLKHLAWSVNATLGFTDTLLRVVPKTSNDNGVNVIGPRLSAYLDFAMGLRDRFEVNVAVPFAVVQSTDSGTPAGIMLKSAGTGAIGDARVGGSVLLYGKTSGPQVGLAATVAVPVGSQNSFTGDRGVGAELLATAGFAGPGYRVIVNGGVRYRPEADYVTSDQGTEFVGRARLLVPVVNQRLVTSLEFDVMARASGPDAFTALGSPILALLGARYHFPGGLSAGAGVGAGLTEAPGSPAVRALVTVGYSPEPKKPRLGLVPRPDDADGDGILDVDDKCPSQPEDKNGFEDADGCPDVPNDKDKLVDNPPEPAPLTLEQVITLPAPIEFKFDTAIMLPGAEVYLNQVLKVLQNHPEVLRLEIQGHTSSEGGAEYNMRLSNDRAKAVFQWLVDHGIDAQRLTPRGYGLTQPLLPNDSEPNRQRNRRVQFRLLEQLPEATPNGSPGASPPPSATLQPSTTPPPSTTSPPSTTPPPAPKP